MYKEIAEYTNTHHVKLVAVSKTKPVADIQILYDAGQIIFGENKVQEMVEKYQSLPKDIQWHLIGHLQKNKVKYIAPFVSMIHSVDSAELLDTIYKEAAKNETKINILLQFHIAKEETKFGLDIEEATNLLDKLDPRYANHVSFCGVMGMASFTSDENIIRNEFRALKTIFQTIKNKYFSADPSFCEISMGMSSDYKIAIEEGSTMVRIGSAIFGHRP
ncbi:MAG: YggS family pyridoxal phosphate-dependent enzyme [Saprospiraceae bacterium]|nr:YggS family pyridoxal phosphate-dependent enzyme [Saprospiraceae bacterium]